VSIAQGRPDRRTLLPEQEFVPVARELEGNWTSFTPHYIVWVCPETYRESEECQSQCIHNGRYCTPDPDGDLQAGYSGKDIVQVCFFPFFREGEGGRAAHPVLGPQMQVHCWPGMGSGPGFLVLCSSKQNDGRWVLLCSLGPCRPAHALGLSKVWV
jgi:hypothetical protein